MFRVLHRGSVNYLSPPSGQEFHEQEVKPSHVRALRFPNVLTAPLAIGNPFLRGVCLWEGDGGAVWGAGATLTSDSSAVLTSAHGFLVTNTWARWFPSVLRTTSGGDVFMPHIYRQGHRRSEGEATAPGLCSWVLADLRKPQGLLLVLTPHSLHRTCYFLNHQVEMGVRWLLGTKCLCPPHVHMLRPFPQM